MRCRSCLANTEIDDINLSDPINDEFTYYDCFFMCTQVFVDQKEALTTKLCKGCANELQRILPFVQTAQETDKQFKQQKEQQNKKPPVKNEVLHKSLNDVIRTQNENQLESHLGKEGLIIVDNAKENSGGNQTLSSKTEAAAGIEKEKQNDMIMYHLDDDDDFRPEFVLCALHECPVIKERFKCPQCTKMFYSTTHLNEHQQLEHGSFCKSCELYFSDKTELKRHNFLVHTIAGQFEGPPSSTVCYDDQNYGNNNNDNNINNIENEEIIITTTTEKEKKTVSPAPKKQLTDSKKNSRVEAFGKYRGSQSLGSFKSSSLLLHNEKIQDQGNDDSNQIIFVCDQCKREFKRQSALDYHRRVVHTERDNICEICGNAFKLKNQLKNHMKLHLEKNLYCPYCDKRYARNIDLTVHLRSHTGELPFACNLCDRRFAIKVRLTYHMQRHLGIQHKCPHCNSIFNSRQKLKIHSYKHSGMPYRCDLCETQRGFPSRETFRRHLKGIHATMLSNDELDAMFKRNTGKTKRLVTIDEVITPD